MVDYNVVILAMSWPSDGTSDPFNTELSGDQRQTVAKQDRGFTTRVPGNCVLQGIMP